ncbi:hypothetical protein DP116_00790 [Brasilonema bromeliae SPC951]|uniref:Transposase IS66 central domain-containing protein n=1 Tax=Brasilonema bromeliae SPC951 TaxID=385972 RepID=A0ABX1P323_9CYAN|nr:hypothetical protein [Brasilonema bromeliae SPC951]
MPPTRDRPYTAQPGYASLPRIGDSGNPILEELSLAVARSAPCSQGEPRKARSRVELEQLLGTEYRGVNSSDDFSVYNAYCVASHQKCLAHLRRHFLRLMSASWSG